MRYVDLRHDCDTPRMDHVPKYGERHQLLAVWRCPDCHQRWRYETSFLHDDRFYWERVGGPSRRWRKAEAQRLNRASEEAKEEGP